METTKRNRVPHNYSNCSEPSTNADTMSDSETSRMDARRAFTLLSIDTVDVRLSKPYTIIITTILSIHITTTLASKLVTDSVKSEKIKWSQKI